MINDYHPDSTQFFPSEAGDRRPRNRASRGVIQISSNPRAKSEGLDMEAIRRLGEKGGARRTGEHPVMTEPTDLKSIKLAPQSRTRERSNSGYNSWSKPKKALITVGALAVGAGVGWGLGKLSEDNPVRDDLYPKNGSPAVDHESKINDLNPGTPIVVEGSSSEQAVDVSVVPSAQASVSTVSPTDLLA